MTPNEMTDEQVLDAWHVARMAHLYIKGEGAMARTALMLKAEAVAIRRFGVGEHREVYRRRYPEAE